VNRGFMVTTEEKVWLNSRRLTKEISFSLPVE
jgi:hypothetical protein